MCSLPLPAASLLVPLQGFPRSLTSQSLLLREPYLPAFSGTSMKLSPQVLSLRVALGRTASKSPVQETDFSQLCEVPFPDSEQHG